MRWRLAASLLLLGVGAAAQAGGRADAREALRGLVDRAEARRGLRHRSLVLVALVAKAKAPEAAMGLELADLRWRPGKGKAAALRAVLEPVGQDTASRLLPGGTWLRPGHSERLVTRPGFVAGSVGALPVPPLTAAPVTPPAPGTVDGVAPVAYRHTLFQLADTGALKDLLALHATLVGLDPADRCVRLADVAKARRAETPAAKARKALAGLPAAYGGEVLGHVAFLGNRVVEVVVAPAPTLYRAYFRQALRGLALSLVLWEELYGRAGTPRVADEPRWERFLEATRGTLATLRGGVARRARVPARVAARGTLWRLRATRDVRGAKPSDVGWLLLDAKGRAAWLEAWPLGALGPLQAPAREPGGRGTDEDPHDRKGGALTKPFLERYLKRFETRRRAAATGG